jgi:ATP-dependent RNA helicase DeaD
MRTANPHPIPRHPSAAGGSRWVGQAQTGTGKTAAFALPIVERLDALRHRIQALILVPTRELAPQVAQASHADARYLERIRVLPVYGGQPISRQIERYGVGFTSWSAPLAA